MSDLDTTTTTEASFRVLGVPAPQGSKTAVVRGGKPRLLEGGSTKGREAHQAWRTAVGWEARAAAQRDGALPEDAPLTVVLAFFMPKPQSRPKKAVWADRKPDLDKLIRATVDGLADGGLLAHDSRIVSVTASKRYAEIGEPTGALVDVRLTG